MIWVKGLRSRWHILERWGRVCEKRSQEFDFLEIRAREGVFFRKVGLEFRFTFDEKACAKPPALNIGGRHSTLKSDVFQRIKAWVSPFLGSPFRSEKYPVQRIKAPVSDFGGVAIPL